MNNIGAGGETAWFANIFESRGNETLEAVSFYVPAPDAFLRVEVRTGAARDDPGSGELVSVMEDILGPSGYHTVRLTRNVPLSGGERFSRGGAGYHAWVSQSRRGGIPGSRLQRQGGRGTGPELHQFGRGILERPDDPSRSRKFQCLPEGLHFRFLVRRRVLLWGRIRSFRSSAPSASGSGALEAEEVKSRSLPSGDAPRSHSLGMTIKSCHPEGCFTARRISLLVLPDSNPRSFAPSGDAARSLRSSG